MTEPGLKRLGQELRALINAPLRGQQDLPKWRELASNFAQLLHAQPQDLYDRLPHELEHYLADADIRLRDARYAEVQEAKMLSLVIILEAGQLPANPKRV